MKYNLPAEVATEAFLWYKNKTSRIYRFYQKTSVKEAFLVGALLLLGLTAMTPEGLSQFTKHSLPGNIVIAFLAALLGLPITTALYIAGKRRLAQRRQKSIRKQMLRAEGWYWGEYEFAGDWIQFSSVAYRLSTLKTIDSPLGKILEINGRFLAGGIDASIDSHIAANAESGSVTWP